MQFRRLEATQAALRQKSVLLKTTLANMDQGLVMVTADYTVGVVNERALQLLGLPAEVLHEGAHFDEVLDTSAGAASSPTQDEAKLALHLRAGTFDGPAAYERRRSDGTVLEIRSVPLADGGVVRTYTDITERKLAEQRIIHAARHDVLTCLPNRVVFAERLETAIAGGRRRGHRTCGAVSRPRPFQGWSTTRWATRPATSCCVRSPTACGRRSAKPTRWPAWAATNSPWSCPACGPRRRSPSPSGCARAVREHYALPQGAGLDRRVDRHRLLPADGGSAGELLRHADLALYRAKAAGRDTCCVFDAELDTPPARAN